MDSGDIEEAASISKADMHCIQQILLIAAVRKSMPGMEAYTKDKFRLLAYDLFLKSVYIGDHELRRRVQMYIDPRSMTTNWTEVDEYLGDVLINLNKLLPEAERGYPYADT